MAVASRNLRLGLGQRPAAGAHERGAGLAADGESGPRTAAAVEVLQQDLGFDGGIGRIGPETVDALGLDAPDSARISLLLGGSQGTC